ncbi:MAG: Crp/Fnr family transcriptional regulator [Acidobacteria bacterium]|nr:Crp/Fnr family transcriptional regulator [Acidobacteriota bacterium]
MPRSIRVEPAKTLRLSTISDAAKRMRDQYFVAERAHQLSKYGERQSHALGMTSQPLHASSNAILAALPADQFSRLTRHLVRVNLAREQVLYETARPFRHVYFPETCLVSVLADMENGTTVQVAQIGRSGMLGIYLALGSQNAAHQAIICISGTALRMPAEMFLQEFRQPGVFHKAVLHSIRRQIFTISQHVACNRIHNVSQRLAWLLLSIHDHTGPAEFSITQEFMSGLLGSARPEVAKAAHEFRTAGYIRYTRANVTVVNRVGLEAAVCECYGAVRKEFDSPRKPGYIPF